MAAECHVRCRFFPNVTSSKQSRTSSKLVTAFGNGLLIVHGGIRRRGTQAHLKTPNSIQPDIDVGSAMSIIVHTDEK